MEKPNLLEHVKDMADHVKLAVRVVTHIVAKSSYSSCKIDNLVLLLKD
jgi:hypothetical protein